MKFLGNLYVPSRLTSQTKPQSGPPCTGVMYEETRNWCQDTVSPKLYCSYLELSRPWRIPWTEEPCGLQSMGSHSQTRLRRLSTEQHQDFQHSCCSPHFPGLPPETCPSPSCCFAQGHVTHTGHFETQAVIGPMRLSACSSSAVVTLATMC